MYWSAANRLLSHLLVCFAFATFSFGHGLSTFRGCGGGQSPGRLGSLLSLTSAATPDTKENWLQRWRKPRVQFTSLLQRQEDESAVDAPQNAVFEEDVSCFTNELPSTTTAESLGPANGDSDDDDDDDGTRHEIKLDELSQALEKARRYVCDGSVLRPTDDICRSGWSLVHESSEFNLFKRRIARNDGSKGPIEYLMTGSLSDISPFSFLAAQIHRSWRSLWDNTMKEMSQGSLYIQRNHGFPLSTEDVGTDSDVMEGGCHISPVFSSDKLYYRTKWPWPLQDRDYALARRCRIFPQENAFVLVSRSTQDDTVPPVDGVVRVDKYWCHSVVFSTGRNTSPGDGGGGDGDAATGSSCSSPAQPPRSCTAAERAVTAVDTTNHSGKTTDDARNHHQHHHRSATVSVSVGKLQSFAERQWAAVVARRHDHNGRPATTLPPWKLSGIQQRLLSPWTRQSSSRDGPTTATPTPTPTTRDPLPSSSSPMTRSSPATWCNTLHRRGLCFVTMFSDEQQVPLPSRLVDALASVGEKVVPESIRKLCEVARRMDADEGFATAMRIPAAEAGGDVRDDSSWS